VTISAISGTTITISATAHAHPEHLPDLPDHADGGDQRCNAGQNLTAANTNYSSATFVQTGTFYLSLTNLDADQRGDGGSDQSKYYLGGMMRETFFHWRSKPPVGSRMDFSHPLARACVVFALLNEGSGQKVANLANPHCRERGPATCGPLHPCWECPSVRTGARDSPSPARPVCRWAAGNSATMVCWGNLRQRGRVLRCAMQQHHRHYCWVGDQRRVRRNDHKRYSSICPQRICFRDGGRLGRNANVVIGYSNGAKYVSSTTALGTSVCANLQIGNGFGQSPQPWARQHGGLLVARLVGGGKSPASTPDPFQMILPPATRRMFVARLHPSSFAARWVRGRQQDGGVMILYPVKQSSHDPAA